MSTLASRPPLRRIAAIAILATCALLFSLPFILCVIFNAGFLDLANEPLAYRFFYSERIFAGETVVVGVGYLISVLHHAVYGILHLFPAVAKGSLERRLDLFALTTNGILSATLFVLFYLAARSRQLRIGDLALLALVALVPIYGTRRLGFDYALMADYQFLNIVLCVAALLLFQLYWRREGKMSTRLEVVLLGAFVGMAAANKITMLVVAGMVLVPAVAFAGVSRREFALRTLLALTGLFGAFIAVHVISYLGDLKMLASAARIWWSFVSNPGGEPNFWESIFGNLLLYDSYGDILLYGFFASILVFALVLKERSPGLDRVLMVVYCWLGISACLFFVVKRPATPTLFESTIFIFTLSAALLTVVLHLKAIRLLVAASCVFWAVYSFSTFEFVDNYKLVAGSQARAKLKWEVFEETRRLAAGRPIEVIFPDNSFHHEGVFELLLKGASSVFPSWYITTGKTIIERYAPGMTFRYNYSVLTPNAPYGTNRVLVWFDRRDIPPLTSQYKELTNTVERTGVARYQWLVLGKDGRQLTMNVAIIP